MAHYLDPKNDLVFKRVFGEHPHLCMSLLNSLLPLDGPIVSLQYQPAELVPDIPILKNSIVDVRCTDQNGRQFIVEMQIFWTKSFTSLMLLNASKAYIKQLGKSEDFKLLQPIYSLCFVNQIFEPEMPEKYFHHYKIVNIGNTEKQIKGLAEGKTEVVLNAYRNGLSMELIQSITGLSGAQIQEILSAIQPHSA